MEGVVIDGWRGRRVLLTGHTGFKGSWLALWLERLGAEVMGYALAPETTPSHFDLAEVAEGVTHHVGDVRDLDGLMAVARAFEPEVVFHLAAQALVLPSYESPKETFDINVGGTVNLLEVVRAVDSVRACVVITTDKCYENTDIVWGYRESDPMGGSDPYSASKGAAELVVTAYRRSFFSGTKRAVGVASARAGNVVGGGDWAAYRIVPDCVRALAAGQPITVRNPAAVRPWQHVLEPLGGYLLLAQRLLERPDDFASGWNFGPGGADAVPVQRLVNLFIEAWGAGSFKLTGSGDAPAKHEARVLRLCTDKARYDLGWAPVLTGDETIRWTAEWYRAWHDGTQAMRAVSMAQIDAYQARLSPA